MDVLGCHVGLGVRYLALGVRSLTLGLLYNVSTL